MAGSMSLHRPSAPTMMFSGFEITMPEARIDVAGGLHALEQLTKKTQASLPGNFPGSHQTAQVTACHTLHDVRGTPCRTPNSTVLGNSLVFPRHVSLRYCRQSASGISTFADGGVVVGTRLEVQGFRTESARVGRGGR